MPNPLLTPEQVSERLAINVREVLRLARSKRLPSIMISPRLRRFQLEDLERFLQENRVENTEIEKPQRRANRPRKRLEKAGESERVNHFAEVRKLCQ